MLGFYPVAAVLLTKDLAAARAFYVDKLELEVVSENDAAITLDSDDTRIILSLSTTGSHDPQTKLAWIVDNLESELDALRERGIKPQNYDSPELSTVDGIADMGSFRSAWILDPDGNALSIQQPK